MARGDFTVFNEFLVSVCEGKINLETDTFKLGLITNTVTPVQDTATPMWSAGSSQEYDGNEVSTGGGYPAGGLSMSGPQFTRATNVGTFDDDGTNFSLAQNGSGFTNAYWGILYSDTATNKDAVGFVDLGGPVSEQDGPINININASGVLTITN